MLFWKGKYGDANPTYIRNNHDYTKSDAPWDPDIEPIAKAGLKTIKAYNALQRYEKNGEPVFDSMGAHIEGNNAVNLAHHEELKKNWDKNLANEGNLKAQWMHADPYNHKIGELTSKSNQQLSEAIKHDNSERALRYKFGLQGKSTSKDREIKARTKKNYTIVGGRGYKGGK